MRPVIAAIQKTEVKTLFGVGVKLASLPVSAGAGDECYIESAISVMRDIDRMLGSNFAPRYAEDYTSLLATWDQPVEDEDEAA